MKKNATDFPLAMVRVLTNHVSAIKEFDFLKDLRKEFSCFPHFNTQTEKVMLKAYVLLLVTVNALHFLLIL